MPDVLRSLSRSLRRATNRLVIRNYREYCTGTPHRRALVSYLMHPLLLPARFRHKLLFSPFGIAQEIPRALNEMGYAVDIVAFDNIHWRPRGGYDLFIGHGGINFERLADAVGPSATKIYFASGLYWKEWNRRVAERLSELAQRTGWLLPPERAISHDEETANAMADATIHLGNAHAGASYAHLPNIHGINNAAYPVTWGGWGSKDYGHARSGFLFYQGPGNVHKGLDRILEAFAGAPQLELHVCQDIEPRFRKVYEGLLAGAPNIHVHGFIAQRSAAFYDLARRCSWVLSATCAEGQPGSVIEAMAHGLIPIVPESANIDIGSWGIRLQDCSVLQIAATCAAVCEISASTCEAMAQATVAETLQKYSVENFRRSFKDAVQNALKGASSHRGAVREVAAAS